MPLKKINATEASVKPAEVEKTYPNWRLMRFNMVADGNSSRVVAILQKGIEDLDGNWEMSPLPSDSIRLIIDDLDAAMALDPALEATANSILTAVENFAIAQGKL